MPMALEVCKVWCFDALLSKKTREPKNLGTTFKERNLERNHGGDGVAGGARGPVPAHFGPWSAVGGRIRVPHCRTTRPWAQPCVAQPHVAPAGETIVARSSAPRSRILKPRAAGRSSRAEIAGVRPVHGSLGTAGGRLVYQSVQRRASQSGRKWSSQRGGSARGQPLCRFCR